MRGGGLHESAQRRRALTSDRGRRRRRRRGHRRHRHRRSRRRTAAATAAAAAEAAAAAATAATTAAATAAILGLLHGDLTSLDVAAVDLLDRLAGLVLGRHLDEAEAARTAGFTVRDDLGVRYGADAAEQVAQVQLGDRVGQIANVESRSHVFLVAVID